MDLPAWAATSLKVKGLRYNHSFAAPAMAWGARFAQAARSSAQALTESTIRSDTGLQAAKPAPFSGRQAGEWGRGSTGPFPRC